MRTQSIKLDVRINITTEGTSIEVFSEYAPISAAFEAAVLAKVREAVESTVLRALELAPPD